MRRVVMKNKTRRAYTAQFYKGNHTVYWIVMVLSICNISLIFGITWLMQQM